MEIVVDKQESHGLWQSAGRNTNWQRETSRAIVCGISSGRMSSDSGEVKNVYIILQQIYSANGVPDFVNIAQVLYEIL